MRKIQTCSNFGAVDPGGSGARRFFESVELEL